MVKLYSIFILIVLSACSSESDKIEELTKQNQQLSQQLSQIQQNQVTNSQQYIPQPTTEQNQPIIINQQPESNSGLEGGLLGFVAGHAIGSIGNSGSSQSTHTIERNYYERQPFPINNSTSSNISRPTTNGLSKGSTARLPEQSKPATNNQPSPQKQSIWNSRPTIRGGSTSSLSSSSKSFSYSRPSIRRK